MSNRGKSGVEPKRKHDLSQVNYFEKFVLDFTFVPWKTNYKFMTLQCEKRRSDENRTMSHNLHFVVKQKFHVIFE